MQGAWESLPPPPPCSCLDDISWRVRSCRGWDHRCQGHGQFTGPLPGHLLPPLTGRQGPASQTHDLGTRSAGRGVPSPAVQREAGAHQTLMMPRAQATKWLQGCWAGVPRSRVSSGASSPRVSRGAKPESKRRLLPAPLCCYGPTGVRKLGVSPAPCISAAPTEVPKCPVSLPTPLLELR